MSEIPSPSDILITPEVIRINTENGRSTLSLRSNSYHGLAYKIKTNKPRDYIVEPSMGIIIPDQEIRINIKMTNPDELAKEDHKLKIEIYKFDWRKNLDDFKNHIKDENVKCYEKKFDVVFVKKEEMGEFDILEKGAFVVIGIVFLHLIKVMLY